MSRHKSPENERRTLCSYFYVSEKELEALGLKDISEHTALLKSLMSNHKDELEQSKASPKG